MFSKMYDRGVKAKNFLLHKGRRRQAGQATLMIIY